MLFIWIHFQSHRHLLMSQLHPGPENCIWAASRSPQTHPGLKVWMSNALRSFPTYIQDARFLSHLHPCTVSPPSRYQYSTKAPIRMPHLHPGHISPPSKYRVHCHCHCHWVSPQSRSLYLHLAIQVTSHLQPAPPNCILVPSKHHLKPIQVSRCVSHLHRGPFSTDELYLSS